MKIKDLLAGGLFDGWLQEKARRPTLGRGERAIVNVLY
jgi:hypothetical protein